MQINHFFKRKEAVLSPFGQACLAVGLAKVILLFVAAVKEGYKYMISLDSDQGMPNMLKYSLYLDLVEIASISILFTIAMSLYALTRICHRKCPYLLQDFKIWINTSPKRPYKSKYD